LLYIEQCPFCSARNYSKIIKTANTVHYVLIAVKISNDFWKKDTARTNNAGIFFRGSIIKSHTVIKINVNLSYCSTDIKTLVLTEIKTQLRSKNMMLQFVFYLLFSAWQNQFEYPFKKVSIYLVSLDLNKYWHLRVNKWWTTELILICFIDVDLYFEWNDQTKVLLVITDSDFWFCTQPLGPGGKLGRQSCPIKNPNTATHDLF
jgi:hypothetical protein